MSYDAVRQKEINAEFARILQVDHWGQAVQKLNKIVLLGVARKIEKHICYECEKEVILEDFTIAHIQPWRRCFSREGSADLFWDVGNIALEHRDCNTTEDNARTDDTGIRIQPTDHWCNRNVKDKFTKAQLNFDHDLLGIEFGKANKRLFRKIMFTWAEQAGLNNCQICTKSIKTIDDWTIEHIKPWLSGQTDEEKCQLFYSFDNIGFSHTHCNCRSSNLGKGKSGYKGVDWYENKKTGYATWRARIKVGKDHKTLKHSLDPVECAEAYDMGIIKYVNGEGSLNFPEKVDEYNIKIQQGWNEPLRCKICGGKHAALGYCRKHHYEYCGGKEKRKQRYEVKGE